MNLLLVALKSNGDSEIGRDALGDLVFDGNAPFLRARSSPGSAGSSGFSGSEGDGLLSEWQISTMLDAEQAIVFANNFVWHDVMALLADWGWTVKSGLSHEEYQAGKNILVYPWPLRQQIT